MNRLDTLGSRGGIGRRKGLKIRAHICLNCNKHGISLRNTLATTAAMSFINRQDRHKIVALGVMA